MNEYVSTGVTYGSAEQPPRPNYPFPKRPLNGGPFWLAGGLLTFAFTLFSLVGRSIALDRVAILAPISALLFWLSIRSIRRRRAGSRLLAHLKKAFVNGDVITEEEWASLDLAIKNPLVTTQDRLAIAGQAYVVLVESMIMDAIRGRARAPIIERAQQLLALSEEYTAYVCLAGYRRAHLQAVSDHQLTPDEEHMLEALRTGLHIQDQDIAEEMEALGELQRVRSMYEGALPTVSPSVALASDETCHYWDNCRLLKIRVLRSYQVQGQRVKEEGLQIEKEGQLLITNKRLLLVHAGTTSIPLSKVLDVRVNPVTKLISLTKDGAVHPILLTSPRALEAAVLLKQLLQREH